MIDLLMIPLAGWVDRIRGGWQPLSRVPSIVGTLAYGWILAHLLGHGWDVLTLPFLVLFRIGESFGWGTPLANALGEQRTTFESWQVGPLRKNPWLSLVVRGAMWGGPVALLGVIDPAIYVMLPAFVIAMPLAPALIVRYNRGRPSGHLWGAMEVTRGVIASGIVAFAVVPL